jgi:MFS family permease
VESGQSPAAILRASLQDLLEVWRHPRLRPALQAVFWMVLGIGATNPLMLLFVQELGVGEGRSEVLTGLLLSCVAGANLVAMPLWGRIGDRHGHAAALRLCTLLAAVTLLLHVVVWNFELLFALRLLLALAMAGSSPLAYGLAAVEIGVERRGGAMGAVFASRTLAIALSAMVGGALSAWVGIRGLFLLGGMVLVVMLVRGERSRGAAAPPR